MPAPSAIDVTRSRALTVIRVTGALAVAALVVFLIGPRPLANAAVDAVTLVGTFQDDVGCATDWDPTCTATDLHQDSEGLWSVRARVPAGTYEYKVAIDHSWDVSYGLNGGQQNAPLTVAGPTMIEFTFDDTTHRIGLQPLDLPGDHESAGDDRVIGVPSRSAGTGNQFYFALTDRFANGDPSNDRGRLNGDRWTTGYDPTDANMFHGGDFAGLQQKLHYLAGLGTTALWVTPPMKGSNVMRFGDVGIANYHGYWTLDLNTIDPHLGTEQTVKKFIAAAHRAGIKVYFDIEINTTADVIKYKDGGTGYVPIADRPWTDANGETVDLAKIAGQQPFPTFDANTSFPHVPVVPDSQAHAKKPDWLNDPTLYHNRGDSTFAGESVTYGDFAGLDDLMTENPKVVDGMIEVYDHWVDFGVDGFRIDTVKHVNFEFWQTWTKAVMSHAHKIGKRDFFMFGEVLDGDPTHLAPYLRNTRMGGVLDFPFAGSALNFAKGSTAQGLSAFFATDDLYTTPTSSANDLETFLSNHDLGRIGLALADADHPTARDQLAQALMLLSRGQPVVYYGDEQGFTGGPDSLATDVQGREDMFGTQVDAYAQQHRIDGTPMGTGTHYDTHSTLYQEIAALGRLRQQTPALRTGAQIELYAAHGPGVYAFSRVDRKQKIEHLVVVNNAAAAQTVTLNSLTSNTHYRTLYGSAGPSTASGTDGELTIAVPPLSVAVLAASKRVDAPHSARPISVGSPSPGAAATGLAPVSATVPEHTWQETSFAWRIAGSNSWHRLGTADSATPRTYHDVTGLAAGTLVEYRAITTDAAGHHSAASSYGSVGFAVDRSVPTEQHTVTVPGTHNAAMGCAANWDPACPQARLTQQSDGTWSGTFAGIPAGSYEFKVAIDGTWDTNYGAGGAPNGPNMAYTTAGGPVTFTYDPNTHIATVKTG